jgi:hypothetical protein
MNFIFFHSISSRSAASARRSAKLASSAWWRSSSSEMGEAGRLALAVELHLEQPVNQEVGIAPDGRGEVRVAGGGQREVPVVGLRVAGLAHRTQHQVAEDALLGLAGNLGSQLLIHLRGNGDLLRDLDLLRPPAMRSAGAGGRARPR